jgi:hypothetical protein
MNGMVRSLGVLASAGWLAACFAVQGYDGAKRESDELARISGDPSVSAGAPLSLILRKVDDVVLNVAQTSVDVLPGTHTLLIDCRIGETRSVSRHSLEVQVDAGERYHLTAETEAGLKGCAGVSLRASD